MYKEEELPEIDLEELDFAKITEVQSRYLEAIPTGEEIKEAVWSCDGSKALGYDGYNMNFHKENVEHCRGRDCGTVRGFFQGKEIPMSINTT